MCQLAILLRGLGEVEAVGRKTRFSFAGITDRAQALRAYGMIRKGQAASPRRARISAIRSSRSRRRGTEVVAPSKDQQERRVILSSAARITPTLRQAAPAGSLQGHPCFRTSTAPPGSAPEHALLMVCGEIARKHLQYWIPGLQTQVLGCPWSCSCSLAVLSPWSMWIS